MTRRLLRTLLRRSAAGLLLWAFPEWQPVVNMPGPALAKASDRVGEIIRAAYDIADARVAAYLTELGWLA